MKAFTYLTLAILTTLALGFSNFASAEEKAAPAAPAAPAAAAPAAPAADKKAEPAKVDMPAAKKDTKMNKAQAKAACKQQGKKGKDLKKCIKEMTL